MEFDKSRIYTAVNAEELPIGSRCVFADTVKGLRRKVEEDTYRVETFYRLHNNGGDDLFVGNDCAYCYAYLIEPPAESKYRPFASSRSLTKAIGKHGDVVKKRKGLIDSDIVYMNDNEGTIILANVCDQFRLTSQELLDGYIFASDGTPCGELVEE